MLVDIGWDAKDCWLESSLPESPSCLAPNLDFALFVDLNRM
jgi:hypothetical protein